MVYIYDGSLEGLLTCIFYGYNKLNILEDIRVDQGQIDLFGNSVLIESEEDKAERVLSYLENKFGKSFFLDLYYSFLSSSPRKEISILRTIYLGRDMGYEVLNSRYEPVLEFMNNRRRVSNERHFYLGLLRFAEMEDGTLYAEFEAENNILPVLMGHFKNRLANRHFMIHDLNRKLVGIYNGEISLGEACDLELKYSSDEEKYRNLWKTFHKTVAIEGRKNSKLQQSNLPKKYWKHLLEMEKS